LFTFRSLDGEKVAVQVYKTEINGHGDPLR
jgi:hypothetical protein